MSSPSDQSFDLVVLGAGPGGYTAAIKAAQNQKKVAIIEMDRLGGVCLNRGCIPTKALIEAATLVQAQKGLAAWGINAPLQNLDGSLAVQKAQAAADRMRQGVEFLMKKNKIAVFSGKASFVTDHAAEVLAADGATQTLQGNHFIIATGASFRSVEGLRHDHQRIINASEALALAPLPKKILVVGAGAIGMELAFFWRSFGVEVEIFEVQNHLLPIEDEEVSKEIERSYRKLGIVQHLGVQNLKAQNLGDQVELQYYEKDTPKTIQGDYLLLAIGMQGNTTDLGLEKIGVEVQRSYVVTNEYGQSSRPHIYAIGDVAGPPLLAHAAAHEGLIAVEHLLGKKPSLPRGIAACTYTYPLVASVGMTEKQLNAQGIKYKVGKVLWRANGKAVASGKIDGFIKVLVGEDQILLGAHIVGADAPEMIQECTLIYAQQIPWPQVAATIHPHPTFGEALVEAFMATEGKAINL
jgi:dihydrolipoamide dehydrogenase